MKFIIRLLIIFAFALAIAGISLFDTGSVIFNLHSYQVELSVNLLVIIVLALFIAIYYLVRTYINLRRLPLKIQRSHAKNRLAASRKFLNSAGVHFFEGRYRSCLEDALKSIKKESSLDNQFLAYMLAYKSANIMRDSKHIEAIATQVEQFNEPKWLLAKYLLIAENFYNQRQYGLAIDNLNAVLNIDHRHVPAHFLLMKTYLNLENYSKAYDMLEWLLKNDSIREYKANQYKLRVLSGLFRSATELSKVQSIYNKLDKAEKTSIQYVKLYFDTLLRLQEYDAALKFIQDNSKNSALQIMLSDAFLNLSKANIAEDCKLKLLNLLGDDEVISTSNDYRILLTAGVLNYKLQRYELAQKYLALSLKVKATIDANSYLALIAKETSNQALVEESYTQIINLLIK